MKNIYIDNISLNSLIFNAYSEDMNLFINCDNYDFNEKITE